MGKLNKKVIVAMSPKQSLRDATGKAGGEKDRRVLVAMSGGVDSSVAAALLKKQGLEVVGVFLKLANKKLTKKRKYLTDEQSARKVAKILKIPFKIIDAQKEFRKSVIDYMLKEFQSGRTPNPCVVCNPKVKFETLIKLVNELNAEYVATGHYAHINKCKVQNAKCKIKEEFIYRLFEGRDKAKDQSYFLYGLNQKQLARIIFPLGNYKKTEVKNMARRMKLPVYDRKESHDVCFASGKLEDYLRNSLKLRKGDIIDLKGKILGKHQGLPLYTIGQRKGIELGGKGPYYVLDKDIARNRLIVSNKPKDSKLYKELMIVKNINWISQPAKFPSKASIRIRYGHPTVRGIINSRDKRQETRDKIFVVKFKEAQRAITPGQSAVFYGKNGEAIGGGIIIS